MIASSFLKGSLLRLRDESDSGLHSSAQLTLIVQEMFKNDEGFKLAGVLRSQAAEGIDDVG